MNATRPVFGFALLAAAGACTTATTRDPETLPGALPYAAIRAPLPEGVDEIMLLAGFGGRFRIDADCVLVEIDAADGKKLLPIFYAGTLVGRDAEGFYLRDRENRLKFRDGDGFRAGGGFMPARVLDQRAFLQAPVDPACRAAANGEAVSINPAIARG